MTEFIVASLVLIPLFVGMYFLAKYGDIKLAANQASRYASMARAIDSTLTPAQVAQETRVRFFTAQEARNGGALSSTDVNYKLDNNKDQVGFWRDLAGRPLITDLNAITVGVTDAQLGGATSALDAAAKALNGLQDNDLITANVEVPIANILPNVSANDPMAKLNLKIAASTTTAGNAWNAAGNADVKARTALPAVIQPIAGAVTGILNLVIGLMEKSGGPQIWCTNPDVVPRDRVDGLQNYPLCTN